MCIRDRYYPDLVEPDDFVGVLAQGLQLPPGLNYVVKRPDSAYGTPPTIHAIQEAIRGYHQRNPGGPKIHVGDISRRGGGLFPPHLSHRHGRDVDVGYVLLGDPAVQLPRGEPHNPVRPADPKNDPTPHWPITTSRGVRSPSSAARARHTASKVAWFLRGSIVPRQTK